MSVTMSTRVMEARVEPLAKVGDLNEAVVSVVVTTGYHHVRVDVRYGTRENRAFYRFMGRALEAGILEATTEVDRLMVRALNGGGQLPVRLEMQVRE